MSSRSAKVSANRERRRAAGGIPPPGNNTARMQLCGLSKARPISCSDCPALPAAPNVTLLDCRKSKPHPWSHANTTFTEQIYIRWCCLDLSNAPRKPDISNNVGSVKAFLSALLRSLRRVSCFVFVGLCIDDHGSLVIDRSASVRPKHLSDQNFDHDYFFELPSQGAGCPIKCTAL